MATDNVVSASARGASFLILLQIGSRALTFGLNQVLLRFLSPELLGVAVQQELYVISTQYFARESLRIATQRRADGGVQAAINLSYISLLLGLPFATFFAWLYLSYSLANIPYILEGLAISAVAALVELCSEPAFVAVQQTMLYKIRAAAEATAVILKTVTTVGIVFWGHYQSKELGILPFAVGELAYCASMSVVFLYQTSIAARAKNFSLYPTRLPPSPQNNDAFMSLIPRPLLALGISLYVQTGIKWLLTEGDKLLITALATLEDQGMYAVAANYGGLIARMLFRPIEESCRNLFGNLCTDPTPSTDEPAQARSNSSRNENTKNNLISAATILNDILHVYSLASLIVFALGPTGAPLLLHIIAGARWTASGAGEVLGTYSYYIPFMATNGVSEAFVAATASTAQLRRQSFWMAGFFAAFGISAWGFVRVLQLGARGLVWANCVNLGLRIMFNLYFVRDFFRQRGVTFQISKILPSPYAIAASAVVPGVLAQTRSLAIFQAYGLLGELVRISGIGAVFVVILLVVERRFLLDCYRRFKS